MDELVDALQREGQLPTPQVRAALARPTAAPLCRPTSATPRTRCGIARALVPHRVLHRNVRPRQARRRRHHLVAELPRRRPRHVRIRRCPSRPPNSATVLDVGCGSGYLLAAFAALGARAAHGVEYAPDLATSSRIEFARARRRAARRRPRHRDDRRRLATGCRQRRRLTRFTWARPLRRCRARSSSSSRRSGWSCPSGNRPARRRCCGSTRTVPASLCRAADGGQLCAARRVGRMTSWK